MGHAATAALSDEAVILLQKLTISKVFQIAARLGMWHAGQQWVAHRTSETK